VIIPHREHSCCSTAPSASALTLHGTRYPGPWLAHIQRHLC